VVEASGVEAVAELDASIAASIRAAFEVREDEDEDEDEDEEEEETWQVSDSPFLRGRAFLDFRF
jgi:hypothetical protein